MTSEIGNKPCASILLTNLLTRRLIVEPVTTVGLAIATYLAKDGVAKLLGPTADYLGEGIMEFTQRRIENIGKVLSNAYKKVGSQLEKPGQVPPRVLKAVINEASYCEDPLVLEYFGGVLASSRTESGRDDRGVRLAKVVDNLSAYQIRTHYLLYSTIATLFSSSGKRFGTQEARMQLQVFLPNQGYAESMMFSQEECDNPQIMHHIWNGLSSDDLIEAEWRFGPEETLKRIFARAPGPGIVCTPSALGAELFLWAFGYGNTPLEHMPFWSNRCSGGRPSQCRAWSYRNQRSGVTGRAK